MTLVVIGNAERSLSVAAVASMSSGERVMFTTDEASAELTVQVEGSGFSGLAEITSIAPDAVAMGDCFVVTGTTKELDGIFAARPEVFAGKQVLIAPGGFGGALVFAERFRQWGVVAPKLSEVPGWMFGGRLQEGRVRIVLRKRNTTLAAVTDQETDEALSTFGRFFPDLMAADLITTSLSNVNAIIHPPLALLNGTRIDNGELWHYWDEGFSPAVVRLMEAVDRERLQVIEALGGSSVNLLEMASSSYAADGRPAATYFEAMKSSSVYRNRPGPTDLNSRFLTDDVPYGVAGYEQLAARLGLDHPTLTAVRVLAEVILGRELKADPFAVDALLAYAQQRSGSTADIGTREK